MRYAAAEEYASAKAEFGLVWLVYLLGGAAVLALVARPALLAAAVLGVVFALVAYRLPELLLVFFVVVGPLKGTEAGSRTSGALAGAGFPVDLTVLAAAGLAVAVSVSLWRRRGEPLAVPPAAVFFLALAVLLLVGVLVSPDPEGGLDKALAFQAFSALAFFAPVAIVRTRAAMYRLLALVVAVAVLVGLSVEEAERSESVLVLPGGDNQIQVGLLLGIGVVSTVAYLWPASRGWMRLAWLVPAGFLLLKLVSAGGRSALAGTLLACLVAVACLVRVGGRDRLAALALVGILAALLPAAWVTSSPAVKDRYLVTIEDVRGGAGLAADGADRAHLAGAAVDLFAAHPFGVGTGGYRALTGYEWPHNLALEVASELGIPGLAALAALFLGLAVELVRAARRPAVRREAIGAAALLVVPLTVSFASFDLNGNRALWFASGLALAATRLRN
jgi:O-antigen ligase